MLHFTIVASFGAILLTSLEAVAQCTNVWQTAAPVPGTDGDVYASVVWDPDGAGPTPACVVIGGQFTTAGGAAAANIAMWNPATATWSALGSGISGSFLGVTEVSALAVLPNGRLAVGGSFSSAGGVTAGGIATWDGASWASVGGGTDGAVYSMLVLANGDLVVGGVFFTAGGVAAQRIARWNGGTWSPYGNGLGHFVYALAQLPNGDLVAGGTFFDNVQRWDGSAWVTLGSGLYSTVYSLAVTPNGELLAGGYDGLKRWNGLSWAFLGSIGHLQVVHLMPNGDVIAGGQISPYLGGPSFGVARWSGTAWVGLGGGLNSLYANPIVFTMTTLPNGDLLAAGRFDHADSGGADNVATWDGVGWWSVGRALNGDVNAFVTLPNGDDIVGGGFTTAGGGAMRGIARWNGSSWFAVGGGVNGAVYALLRLANGDLVVGGAFTAAGGIAANNIARWDGTGWSAFGAGVNGAVRALALLPNGDVVVGGTFTSAGGVVAGYIARWNGVAWAPFGSGMSPIYNGGVYSLLAVANGDLIAGGRFTTAGSASANQIARWDGSAWSALGSGMSQAGPDGVFALAIGPSGDLLAAGSFTTAGGAPAASIARWNGAGWSSLGSGPGAGLEIMALGTLAGGDLVAGGRLNSIGGPSRFLGRWNGSTWIPVGTGSGPSVAAFARRPNDDLVVGLTFDQWGNGGGGKAMLATLSTTCPALSAPFGTGCAGTGGTNLLVGTTLPWLGTTFRARATGLAANSLAVAVYAFQQTAIPMPMVHPQGIAGCTLLVDGFLYSFPVAGGAVETAVAIPTQAILIGANFYHQVVPIELSAAFDIAALTATNGLAQTIGAF
jgi:hypothetical protein